MIDFLLGYFGIWLLAVSILLIFSIASIIVLKLCDFVSNLGKKEKAEEMNDGFYKWM